METTEIFSKRLTEARKMAGHTQATLAEAIGVDLRSVNNYEGKRGFPRPDVLDKISSVLEQPLAWFFLEDDQRIENGERPVTPQEALAVLARHIESGDSESSPPTSASDDRAPGESRLEGVQKGAFGRRGGKRSGKSERKRDHG